MTRLIITIGPQGAGKTTFCNTIMEQVDRRKVACLCRDSFLEGLFGKDVWNPYLMLAGPGMQRFWRQVAAEIKTKEVVIVDSFFPSSAALANMQHQLATELQTDVAPITEALWFTTPDPLTADQYAQRYHQPGDHMFAFWRRDALDRTKAYWVSAQSLRGEIGIIWEIDPRQGVLDSYAHRLALPR